MVTRKIQSYKAYQILAHLIYKDHEFFERDGDWVKMYPATTFCRMLMLETDDLKRHLKYLKKKGYIYEFTHGRGFTTVRVNPTTLIESRIEEADRMDNTELAKAFHHIITLEVPERTFDPYTLTYS